MGNLQSTNYATQRKTVTAAYKRRMPQKKPLTFKRGEIIDEEKESQLLSTVIGLALESNKFENGWNIHAGNRSLQTKLDPISKRPIARSIARNKSTTTLKQIYDYFKMGDNKERKHIIYHIDKDHDIEYVIDETSDADSQYMCVRHTTSITDQSQKFSYKVVVRLLYDISESHPVYRPSPDKYTRMKVKCEAHVCFSRDSAPETDFTFVCINFTPDSGGLLSKWKENAAASQMAVHQMNVFQKKCELIPQILQKRKDYNELQEKYQKQRNLRKKKKVQRKKSKRTKKGKR